MSRPLNNRSARELLAAKNTAIEALRAEVADLQAELAAKQHIMDGLFKRNHYLQGENNRLIGLVSYCRRQPFPAED